jgi:hypothetical protein
MILHKVKVCSWSTPVSHSTCYSLIITIKLKAKGSAHIATVLLVYILQNITIRKLYISQRFVSIYQVMTLYCFPFVFDAVIDCRKLQCLGCFQRHNIHTKVHENCLVGTEVERGWHTLRHGYFICLFYSLKKESGLKTQLSASRVMCIHCYNSIEHGQ